MRQIVAPRGLPVLAWLLTAAALAGDPALEAWVEEVIEDHPSLDAVQARIDAADASAQVAGRWSDPRLMLQYSAPFSTGWIGDHPMAGIEARVTQRLNPPRWSAARTGAAQASADAVASRSQELVARVGADLRVGWYALAASSARIDVLTRLRNEAETAVRSARGRYAVGVADDRTVLRMELLVEELDQRLEDARRDLATARADLVAVAGTALETLPSLPDAPALPPEGAFAVGMPPSVQRLVLEAEARSAAATGARVDGAPAVDLWFGVMGRTFESSTDPGRDLFRAGVSVPVPVNALVRARAEAAALNAESRALEHDADALRDALQGRVDALLASWRNAHDAVGRLDAERLPKARQLAETARDAFATGSASGLDLYDAERLLLDLELARIEAVARTWTLRARIAGLLGVYPEEVTP